MTGGWGDRWDAPAEPSWVIEPTSEWHPQFRGQRYPGDIGNRYADPRGRPAAFGRAEVPPLAPTRPDGTYLGRSWADQDDESPRGDAPGDERYPDHDAYRRPVDEAYRRPPDEPIWQRERRRPATDRHADRTEPDRYDGRPDADRHASRTRWSDRRRGADDPAPTGWHRDRAAPDRHRADGYDTPPGRERTAPGVTPVSPGRAPVSPAPRHEPPRHEPPRDSRSDRFVEPGWSVGPDELPRRRRTTGERPGVDHRTPDDGGLTPDAIGQARRTPDDGGHDRRFTDEDRHDRRFADGARHDPYPGTRRPAQDLPTRFREDEPPRSPARESVERPAARGHDDLRRRPFDDDRTPISPIPEDRWQHPRVPAERPPPRPREAASRTEAFPDLRPRESTPPPDPSTGEPWSRAGTDRTGTRRPAHDPDHTRDGREPYPGSERRPAEPHRPVPPPGRYDDRPAARVAPDPMPERPGDRRGGAAPPPTRPVSGPPYPGPPPTRPVSGPPYPGPPPTRPVSGPSPARPVSGPPVSGPPVSPVPVSPAPGPAADLGTADAAPVSAPPAARLNIEFRQPPQSDRRPAAPTPADPPSAPPTGRPGGLEITPDRPRRYVPPPPEPTADAPDTAPRTTPNSSAAWFRPGRSTPTAPATGTTDAGGRPAHAGTGGPVTDAGDRTARTDPGDRTARTDPGDRTPPAVDRSADTGDRTAGTGLAVPPARSASPADASDAAPVRDPRPAPDRDDPVSATDGPGRTGPAPAAEPATAAADVAVPPHPPAASVPEHRLDTATPDTGAGPAGGSAPADTADGGPLPADDRTDAPTEQADDRTDAPAEQAGTGPRATAADSSPQADPGAAVEAGPATTTSTAGTATPPAGSTATPPTALRSGARSGSGSTVTVPGEPDEPDVPAAVPRDDPEQVLAGYRWRLDPQTLREVVDDPAELRILRRRLTEKLASALDNRARARLLSLRAVTSRLVDDLDDALADGRLALTYAEATGELRRTALARARLAEALRWKGEFAEADRLFTEANSTELPDRLRSALHEHAGRCCYDQGRLIEACAHFERALDLRRADDPELTGRIGVALDAVHTRAAARAGFGPYPRSRDEVRHGRRAPRPTHDGRGCWGYADTAGDLVVDYRYAEAQPFHEQVAWVRRPDHTGWELIDEAGGTLLDAGYTRVLPFSDGLAWVSRGGDADWSAIEPDGTVLVPAGFEEVRPFRAGVAAVRRGGWGAVDRHGRLVVPPRYHGITTTLSDGRQLDGFTDEGLAVVELAGRQGVVDRAGTMLVRPVHPALVIHPVAFLVGDGMDHWGALDRRGEPLIRPVHPDRDGVLAEIDRLLADTHPVL
ncbi:WG containing repeat-containing protein [Micromonospora rifamycinica]|uniref:WG containing repeat-containing protein n=1 Tax=Micromonospora rifamycinica TaxID=291594 RepID=A0A1C5KEC8_9ACTN|nr:WG containing repeat-containing protein [Micromonospora rifamycinica]